MAEQTFVKKYSSELSAGARATQGILTAFSSASSARRNASELGNSAEQEDQYGELQASVLRKRGKSVRSSARAGYGAAGVDVNSGSAALAQEVISANAEYDALTAILQSKIVSRELRYKQEIYKSQSSPVSGILGAIGSAAGSYYGRTV